MKNLHLDAGKFRTLMTLSVNVGASDGCGGTIENWQDTQQAWARILPSKSEAQLVAEQMRETQFQLIDFRQPLEISAGTRIYDEARTFEVVAMWDPDETGRYWRCQCREVSL